MKNLLVLTLFTLLISTFHQANCQILKSKDTSLVSKIKTKMAFNDNKMAVLLKAMETNKEALDTLIKSQTISPKEKHKAFLKLMIERDTKVNALLTPAEQERLQFIVQDNFGRKREIFKKKRMKSLDNLLLEIQLPKIEFN